MMKLPALKEIVDERKEKAIEDLSDSFAKNKLPLEEYERLVEYINKIESERELVVVEKMVAEYRGSETPGESRDKSFKYDDDEDDDVPEHYHHHLATRNNLALLSSRMISGPLQSRSEFVSILGSTEIKVRMEDLAKRRTTVDVVSILGETVIYVEPGIRVVNNAIPILGGSWTNSKVNKLAQDRGPELVITGAALLGNITVKLLKG